LIVGSVLFEIYRVVILPWFPAAHSS